jgi:hypothetical protein
MDRHYEALLKDVLRDVIETGTSTVEWRLIYRWLGAKRITRQRWQQVLQMWSVLIEDGDYPEYRLGRDTFEDPTFCTFVLLPPSDDDAPLFKPLEEWA